MTEHQRKKFLFSMALLAAALAGAYQYNTFGSVYVGISRDEAASQVTISGRVFDRTCNIGFPRTVVETCAGTVTTDNNGTFSFQRPIGTNFCIRVNPQQRDGYYGPTVNGSATSQNTLSYEWQNAGVNCKISPTLCNPYQNREDRILDTGYNFSYQNSTGTCNVPTPLASPNVPDAPGTIDTLDYFLTDHPNQGLTGTHPLSYTIGNGIARYVKWVGTAYETYKWDSTYIYLLEDQSQPTVSGGPYSFAPGTWMKRSMRVGESVKNSGNKLSWLNTSCGAKNVISFPYTNTLEAHYPAFDLGGDLGIQDVIVLKYDYGSDYEKMYYAKEWGLVKWELYGSDGRVKMTSVFNMIGGAPIQPVASCIR